MSGQEHVAGVASKSGARRRPLLGTPLGAPAKRLVFRVYRALVEDQVLARSGQLAFSFLFALFPLLILLTSLVGLVVQEQGALQDDLFRYLGAVLPHSASLLVTETVGETIVASSGGKVSFGLLVTLWAASTGVAAMVDALNLAFHVRETRPWWRSRLLALQLTFVLTILFAGALGLVLWGEHFAEAASARFGADETFAAVWSVAQWVLVFASAFGAFVLVYYVAPDVDVQRLRFVLPGAVVGVALWIAASFGLRAYLRYFDSYSSTYGSLGAVMVLMTWFYLSAASILIGGEINSEVERAAAEAGAEGAKLPGERRPSGDRATAQDERGAGRHTG